MCSIELYMFTPFFLQFVIILIPFSLSLFVVLLVSCSLLSRELIPGFKNLGLTTWAKEAGYCTTGPCMYGNKPCKTQWPHMELTASFHKLKHVLCFLFFAGPVTCIYCLAKRQPFVKVTLGLSYKP